MMNRKMEIFIIDIIKTPNALTHKFGLIVYESLHSYLSKGIKVTLSFKGLKHVTSGFCNASIGKLYADFKLANELLILTDITDPIWNEKVDEAISLITNPAKVNIQNKAISELYE